MTSSPVSDTHSLRAKCLIVDDLEENRLALSALLQGDDVDLLLAQSGVEALDLLLRHEVAVALVDVQMPDMDGFELAEVMRSSLRTRDVPIIFVTAGGWDRHRVFRGYDAGAVDFLYKPVDAHILTSKVSVFLQLARQKIQLADELQRRTETLRLHEMFTAVLGHDLRTPLSAIVTGAALIEGQSGDEVIRDIARRMGHSGQRMGRMIDDMLDLSRARLAGGIPVERRSGDLHAIVERMVQEQQAAHPARTIHFRPRGDGQGEWDADRVSQLVGNLVRNALQHGGDGAVDVGIDGESGQAVALTVTNTGAIDCALLPHLFDPFRGGTRSLQDGLGLGLYISQQIVAAHGGHIEASSDVDLQRVCFRVELPRTAATGRPGLSGPANTERRTRDRAS